MDIASEAMFRALEQLEAEWASDKCAACGTEKWRDHPFCRSCSIRLQRARIMRDLQVFAGHTVERILKSASLTRRWFRIYDCARDYLIVTAREQKTRPGTGRTRRVNGDGESTGDN
jgi:hypothetical protein